ncbi:MAG: hypothetical protein HKP36_06815 [Myxococcales bacterium]|nr:alpha/beta hydrolase [Deltaproteobacteria bacterium]NNL24147.1 hypothetical protein [Myxococcales bacterium]NNL84731.1 hypothetical protein [Myxococcales bacterium]
MNGASSHRDDGRAVAAEWEAVGEWATLLADPVYRGEGVARGDGRLVLVLPGLFGNDLYLRPLRRWLARVGYRPVPSSLGLNAGCYERLCRRVEAALQARAEVSPGPIALIGHSRGGMLARAIAARLQARASHLLLLGSPVGAVLRMPQRLFDSGTLPPGGPRALSNASLRARRVLDPDCRFPACDCSFVRDLRRPLHAGTRVVSIHSREDGVVHPAASVLAGAHNVEVTGSHSGLVYNRAVYRELGAALAS